VLPERFAAAVGRAKERLLQRSAEQKAALIASAGEADRERGRRSRFVVRRGNAHYFVPVEDVDWIDAADNYLQLHSGDRTHLWRGTMKDAEDQLDPAKFVRVHRSAIVAVDRITSITMSNASYVIELRSGMRLRSSRNYADRVRSLLE
jgi:two-component system LytT family response regulator